MKTLVPLLLLCAAGHALALDSSSGSPGTATPQAYERPAIRPLPAPATTPRHNPPLLQKLPPAEVNAPAPRLPQLQELERAQQRPADEEGDSRR